MRPIGTRTAWLTALLAGMFALSVASIVVTLAEIDLLQRAVDGEFVTVEEALASDDRVALVAMLYLVGLVVTAVVWCTWQHRAQKNLVQGGVRGLRFTPGWAAGWWFVPFANLWMPFSAMRELWKASDPSADDDALMALRTWPVLGLWWAAWLAGNILAPNLFALANDDATLEEIIRADRFSIASDAFTAIAALLAIAVVRSIGARQAAWVERGPLPRTSALPVPPPPEMPAPPPMP